MVARRYGTDDDDPDEERPVDELPDNDGQMGDASDDDFVKWAERYDELDGAPENEEDR